MKNKLGLFDADLTAIIAVLSKEPKIESAFIFGSRAKGNYKTGSDVDIALKGTQLDFNTIAQLSYQLNEETAMPYQFDILSYHSIKEPALQSHIDRVGVEFYNRSKQGISAGPNKA